jgi:hypothetical protein
MRLLSLIGLVEFSLAAIRPEHSFGWCRRVNYQEMTALFWNQNLGLTLAIRGNNLQGGDVGIEATWHDRIGETLGQVSLFSGRPGFDWQIAAENILEAMPDPTDSPTRMPTEAGSRGMAV